jgi:hypothetical protein
MNADPGGTITEGQVLSILQVRRGRAALFGEGLFSDPAWDILLELFAAELGHRKVRLCDLTSPAPQSTLARWVAALEQQRLVVCDGPLTPSELTVRLSKESVAKMARVLSGAPHLAGWE